MNVIKPMLAKDGDLSKITYPVIVQPKLDGIRCFIVDGVARSRTFKPIPNAEIQAALGRPEFEGLDGELIVGSATDPNCMQATTSFVMAPGKTGEDWTYHVFDKWDAPGTFQQRYIAANDTLEVAKALMLGGYAVLVENQPVHSREQLERIEHAFIMDGHEGIIVRDPRAPYKHGRSGVKGPLLKVKRFIDFEAEVVGVYEEMHNANEATKDAFGRTERSSVKANKHGKGCLGGFVLRALNGPCEGIEFRCGTGFTREQREALWLRRDEFDGREADGENPVVKIKSFPVGVKDAPRFPVWLGFRDLEIDG